MNVIPPNTNMQCYNVTDKVMSVMSKNIDTGKINYDFHDQIHQVFTKRPEEKFSQVN